MLIPTLITAVSLTISTLVMMPSNVIAYNALQAPTTNEKLEVIDMSVSAIIHRSAVKYGANEAIMSQIIECESNFNEKAQSSHRYKQDRPELGVKKGDQERSFGLVQIHLPAHPNITLEQALDPEYSADFLAKNLADNRGYLWSCYK